MLESCKKLIETVKNNQIQNSIRLKKIALTPKLFIKNCLVEIETNHFVLIHDNFNENIGHIEIKKFKNKSKFLCTVDKKTSNPKKNEFYTLAHEDMDFIIDKICKEIL